MEGNTERAQLICEIERRINAIIESGAICEERKRALAASVMEILDECEERGE